MLLANISVAKRIYEYFPEFALLRRHPAPPPANYDILVKAARSKVRWRKYFCLLLVFSCLVLTCVVSILCSHKVNNW